MNEFKEYKKAKMEFTKKEERGKNESLEDSTEAEMLVLVSKWKVSRERWQNMQLDNEDEDRFDHTHTHSLSEPSTEKFVLILSVWHTRVRGKSCCTYSFWLVS